MADSDSDIEVSAKQGRPSRVRRGQKVLDDSDSDNSNEGGGAAGNNNSGDDGGDPVVQEFRVVLNREMEEWACLLRYPHQPAARVAPRPMEARIRPQNDVLELKYNTWQAVPGSEKRKHFDLGGGSLNVSQAARAELEREHKTQTLRSERVGSNGRAYAMGLVDQKSSTLHLVPLRGVYEMRPVLQGVYLTGGDEVLMEEEVVEPEPKASDPTPISVVQFRKQSQRAQVESERLTYKRMKETEEKESWVPLDIVPRASEKSWATYEEHTDAAGFGYDPDLWIEGLSSDGEDAQESENDDGDEMEDANTDGQENGEVKITKVKRMGRREKIRSERQAKRERAIPADQAFKVTQSDYFDLVAPRTRIAGDSDGAGEASGAAGEGGSSANNAIDLSSRKVSLEDQICQKLVRKGALSFSTIMPASQHISGSKTIRKALEVLPKFALLVHGVWVIKSREYCKEQFGEAQDSGSGASALARKCAVRDLVLCLLARSDAAGIDKHIIKDTGVKVSVGEMQAALQSICKLEKETKLWKLKNVDKDTIKWEKSHAKLAASQQEALKKIMYNALTLLSVKPAAARAVVASGGSSKNTGSSSSVKKEK